MKVLSTVFFILAVILSDIMCAVVAYNYCNMIWGIKYAGYSAPAGTAFLTSVPFAAAIAVCVILALYFKSRIKKLVHS